MPTFKKPKEYNSPLPPSFPSSFGETGKEWLQLLPSHIETLASQWHFQFIKPMPDLSYGFVAKVKF